MAESAHDAPTDASLREAARDLVYRASLLLDDQDFAGFLALCAPEFRYVVQTYSPEIRRDMVWLDQDRAGLDALFRNLPKHNSDRSPLSRHVTVYTVNVAPAEAHDERRRIADVVTALQVFRTSLDGGVTTLFAVGKMRDRVRLDVHGVQLERRDIRLDTRMLGIGTHVPF